MSTNEHIRQVSFPIDPGMTSDKSSWKAEINKNNIAIEKITVWLWE
jgi:hypothetical protein